MPSPKALEGAFVEGATMLHILVLLPVLIVEDIDLGNEGKLGEVLKWLTVHAGCLTNIQTFPPRHLHVHNLHSLLFFFCIQLGSKGDLKECNSKHINECGIIRVGINHSSFWPHFQPISLIWSTCCTIGSMSEITGVSHANIPLLCPLPWPWSVLDKFTILFFLKSQSMSVDTLNWSGDRGCWGSQCRADKKRESALF